MSLSKEDRERLCQAADQEGFDYAFTDYSTWDDIDDKKFHELMAAYKKASDTLMKYIDLDGWYSEGDDQKTLNRSCELN